MAGYTRNPAYSSFSGPRVVEKLEALNIELPPAIVAAKMALETLERRHSEAENDAQARGRALEALANDADADVDEVVLAEALADTNRNVLIQAADRARAHLTSAVEVHSDELTLAVRSKVFEPALKQLTLAASSTSSKDTAGDLLLRKETKAATALAQAPVAVAQIKLAFDVRRAIYRGSGIENLTCAVWRNRDQVELGDVTGDDIFVEGIRRGGELWFGTLGEVEDASKEVDAQREAERRAARGPMTLTLQRRSVAGI